MVKRVALLILGVFVTGLTIAVLHSYASVSEPFGSADVSEVRFRHSTMDSTQVCVRNAAAIEDIVRTVRLRKKGECMCAHSAFVAFVVDGEERVASLCSHCFDLIGEAGGSYHMPEEFYAAYQSYRDSFQLRERWENPHISGLRLIRDHAEGRR